MEWTESPEKWQGPRWCIISSGKSGSSWSDYICVLQTLKISPLDDLLQPCALADYYWIFPSSFTFLSFVPLSVRGISSKDIYWINKCMNEISFRISDGLRKPALWFLQDNTHALICSVCPFPWCKSSTVVDFKRPMAEQTARGIPGCLTIGFSEPRWASLVHDSFPVMWMRSLIYSTPFSTKEHTS